MDKLKEKLKSVPKSPGVYQFKNKDGGVVYVGKAKNLRSRIGQYFGKSDQRPQLPYLMAEASDFSYTVVNNELESLYLENTLIKQYLPKYNIMLRDDKNYAFIKIDYSTEIPQIGYARKIDSPTHYPLPTTHSVYFGPYSAAYKIRSTLNLARKIFPFCSNKKVSGRPCFYYYMHRCPGVCVGKISVDDYKQYLQKITKFLRGNFGEIAKDIKQEMLLAAKNKKFEAAAKLRDQLASLKLLGEKQSVILPKKVDWDIISLAASDGYACVNLFKVREGKLQDKENFIYEIATELLRRSDFESEVGAPTESVGAENYRTDVLQKFLEQYYLETSSVPKCVYVQTAPEDAELVEHIIRSRFNLKSDLSAVASAKVEILNPKKGKALELIKLGQTNAREYLKNWLNDKAGHLDKINKALEGLKEILHLEKIPLRVECYDISNIQGTNAVGSMVVFQNGLPKKSEYRKFRIKTKQTPDDFAMMKEMLTRRMARISNFPAYAKASAGRQFPISKTQTWPIPDLIVIDGGKGQLSAALEVMSKVKGQRSNVSIIGLAKRIEEIFLPNQPQPIILGHDNPALQLLQRLRDEAHRFGITFHRKLRSKQAIRSALDDIPGIGPKTKRLLKAKFGTVAQIKKASFNELANTVGEKIAILIQLSI